MTPDEALPAARSPRTRAEAGAPGLGGRRMLALALNGGLALTFLVVWLGLAWRGAFWQADFTAFYTGAALVAEGRGADLYDRDAQAEAQARLLGGPRFPDGVLLFLNPPHGAALLAPLALLPLSAAFYVWAAVQAVLLVVLLRWAARRTAGWPADERLLGSAALLAFPPLFITFQLGQLSLLLLAGLCGLYDGLRRARPRQAGLCLALLTLKPQLAVLPAALLLGGRRWRELGWAAAALAAWAGATTVLLGWRYWPGYLEMMRHAAAQFGREGVDPKAMVTLRALLTAWLGAGHAALVNGLSGAALLLGAAAVAAAGRGLGAANLDRRFALTVILAVLLSPHAYRHDALLLALPALLCCLPTRGGPLAACFLAVPALFAVDTFLLRDALEAVQPLVLLLVTWAAALAVRSADQSP